MAEASGGESSSFAGATTSDDKGDEAASAESPKGKPTCILCLGMAGSGKTTFVQVHFQNSCQIDRSRCTCMPAESLITKS